MDTIASLLRPFSLHTNQPRTLECVPLPRTTIRGKGIDVLLHDDEPTYLVGRSED